MKRLIIATAVILSATLSRAVLSPFRRRRTGATLETPAADTIKVSCGRCRPRRNCCRNQCNGYYSLYTYVRLAIAPMDAVDAAMAATPGYAAAFLAGQSEGGEIAEKMRRMQRFFSFDVSR